MPTVYQLVTTQIKRFNSTLRSRVIIQHQLQVLYPVCAEVKSTYST